MYYDKQGTPILGDPNDPADFMGTLTWARLREDRVYSQIARDEIPQAAGTPTILVSTVWIGLDMAYGDAPPLIFETMVFGGPLDLEQRRYATEAEAILGHVETLARVLNAETTRGLSLMDDPR